MQRKKRPGAVEQKLQTMLKLKQGETAQVKLGYLAQQCWKRGSGRLHISKSNFELSQEGILQDQDLVGMLCYGLKPRSDSKGYRRRLSKKVEKGGESWHGTQSADSLCPKVGSVAT